MVTFILTDLDGAVLVVGRLPFKHSKPCGLHPDEALRHPFSHVLAESDRSSSVACA